MSHALVLPEGTRYEDCPCTLPADIDHPPGRGGWPALASTTPVPIDLDHPKGSPPQTVHPCPWCGLKPAAVFDGWRPGEYLNHLREVHP